MTALDEARAALQDVQAGIVRAMAACRRASIKDAVGDLDTGARLVELAQERVDWALSQSTQTQRGDTNCHLTT